MLVLVGHYWLHTVTGCWSRDVTGCGRRGGGAGGTRQAGEALRLAVRAAVLQMA